MAKSKYYDSPFGKADHPHLNKPDAKFNPENPLFKSGLDVSGDEAVAFAAKVDAAAQEAFDDFMENGDGKNLTPAERKKFSVYKPYEVLEDDEGNPTGVIRFDFKQNAKIRLKDGTTKSIQIGLYDAAGNELDPAKVIVRGGSVVRFRYSLRPIPMKSLKQVGVRLDFAMVQVKELASGGGMGFGAVDGYTADDEDAAPEGGFSAASGDY